MKKAFTLFLALFLFLTSALPASANSAPTDWYGVDAMGAVAIGDDCPIEVRGERLTFTATEFPESYYPDTASFLAYTGRVSAEYCFCNPTEGTVTATLAFPFGRMPSYAVDDRIGRVSDASGAEDYGVFLNGEALSYRIRHTLFTGAFSLSADLSRLRDGYRAADFYSPQMTVTKYTYVVGGVDKEGMIDEARYPDAAIALDWAVPAESARLYASRIRDYREGDGFLRVFFSGGNGSEIALFVIGQAPSSPPTLSCYEDNTRDALKIDGAVSLVATEQLTLEEFALFGWNADTGVLREDWYNAAVDALVEGECDGDFVCSLSYILADESLLPHLLRWYEYAITLAAGASVTNTVTAPLYPAIDAAYEPPVYTYTYLLSPAKGWAKFGRLEIEVDTPFYLVNSSLAGFVKEDSGYRAVLDGLPEGELTFSLSASEEPVRRWSPYGLLFFLPVVVAIVLFLLFAGILALAVIFTVRRIRKRL